jgi:F-type H+-transporting ATPase subunit gamma
METISVAKMRKAMKKFENSRYFFEAIRATIDDIIRRTGHIPNEFFSKDERGVKPLYIVIASDKGLAGGFNHNVFRHAWEEIETRERVSVFTVGQTAREFFEHKGVSVDAEFTSAAFDPDKEDAEDIAKAVLNLYLSGEVDEINISYTKMLSSTSMTPETFKLLPFSYADEFSIVNEMTSEEESLINDIEFDPSPEEVLQRLVPQYLKWILYGALIQSSASEHCSRRYAMSNATKNANGIIADLNIEYNRARQEKITNELAEIIVASSGVEVNYEE